MRIRPWAQFTADFPDDMVEEDGEIVQFPGKGVSEAVGEILTGLGCKVEALQYADENGWEFGGRFEKFSFWCKVTMIDEYLMLFDDNPPMFSRKQPEAHVELIARLHAALVQDGRFHGIRWYSQAEMDRGGEGAPEPGSP